MTERPVDPVEAKDAVLDGDGNVVEEAIIGVEAKQPVYETQTITHSRKHYGLIAQEVESVIPEVVLVSPQPIIIHEGTSDEEEITEVKTLSYGNLVAYLVEAIKELKGEIDKLQEA
jgi:hypothetical protein